MTSTLLTFLIANLRKKEMKKSTDYLIPILGFILTGLSAWVLISLVELQVLVAMLQEELLNIDKQLGRVYAHMDRLMNK
tara:strand:+ start:870 stop:1106 length:237 start_codon:yes stop_codon:yes gene_type:complete